MKHISNEEKARSLCCSGCNDYNCYTKGGSCVQLKNIMRMAQWKDEQEIEFLQSLMFQASTQQALNVIINNRIKLLKGE